MALTEERRAGLLAYCKLTELADDPEVQSLLPVFYDAAVEYMRDAGVPEPKADDGRKARYDLCVNYLCLAWWERRDTAIVSTVVTDNPAFRRLINQLKIVSNSDTPAG